MFGEISRQDRGGKQAPWISATGERKFDEVDTAVLKLFERALRTWRSKSGNSSRERESGCARHRASAKSSSECRRPIRGRWTLKRSRGFTRRLSTSAFGRKNTARGAGLFGTAGLLDGAYHRQRQRGCATLKSRPTSTRQEAQADKRKKNEGRGKIANRISRGARSVQRGSAAIKLLGEDIVLVPRGSFEAMFYPP